MHSWEIFLNVLASNCEDKANEKRQLLWCHVYIWSSMLDAVQRIHPWLAGAWGPAFSSVLDAVHGRRITGSPESPRWGYYQNSTPRTDGESIRIWTRSQKPLKRRPGKTGQDNGGGKWIWGCSMSLFSCMIIMVSTEWLTTVKPHRVSFLDSVACWDLFMSLASLRAEKIWFGHVFLPGHLLFVPPMVFPCKAHCYVASYFLTSYGLRVQWSRCDPLVVYMGPNYSFFLRITCPA